MLRALAEQHDASGESSNHEKLGDLLLEMNRPEQALTEYEADLKTNPNRFNGLYGAARAAEMAGKSEKANGYYTQLVKVCDGPTSESPRAQPGEGAAGSEIDFSNTEKQSFTAENTRVLRHLSPSSTIKPPKKGA